MKSSVFTVNDKIWNTLCKQKYSINNIIVLGFKNKKSIVYNNGARYENCIGLSIDLHKGIMEIGKDNNTISIKVSKSPDWVSIDLDKTKNILVTIS